MRISSRRSASLAVAVVLACGGGAQPAGLLGVPAQTILFTQPDLGTVQDHFFVPAAEHRFPDAQSFNMVLWQPNPREPDGELVPTSWSAGDRTGLYPAAPLRDHQRGFSDQAGVSTVQIDGAAVGAYINSDDLSDAAAIGKMMITPVFRPPAGQRVFPFASPGMALANTLELQVPVAHDQNMRGNFTYVVSDLVFLDRTTQIRITYEFDLFHDGAGNPRALSPQRLARVAVGRFDPNTRSFQIGNPLTPGSAIVTVMAGSDTYQTAPWTGWRPFGGAITAQNFRAALADLLARDPSFAGSQDPGDYALIEWHLNAELQCATGAADLGWSMRDAALGLVEAASLEK